MKKKTLSSLFSGCKISLNHTYFDTNAGIMDEIMQTNKSLIVYLNIAYIICCMNDRYCCYHTVCKNIFSTAQDRPIYICNKLPIGCDWYFSIDTHISASLTI